MVSTLEYLRHELIQKQILENRLEKENLIEFYSWLLYPVKGQNSRDFF